MVVLATTRDDATDVGATTMILGCCSVGYANKETHIFTTLTSSFVYLEFFFRYFFCNGTKE